MSAVILDLESEYLYRGGNRTDEVRGDCCESNLGENNGPFDGAPNSLPEDSASGSSSSSSFKGVNHRPSSPDPLSKKTYPLKFKEINAETPDGNSEDLQRSSRNVQSRIVKPAPDGDDAEIEEFDNLYKQTVETDVEYLVIMSSGVVQRLESDRIERHGEADSRTRKRRDSCFSVAFCIVVVAVVVLVWWPNYYEDLAVAT
ncbi:hypothetical protein M569_05937 [Genlisea aurea]|uniref:Uncharacterized protein n=1 Tax=Genlisea aurea TaxID=192259 RepID=S8CVA9_9LAMI|nr:hypothetical protein M569_05937 [Genlisea aurea]